MTDATEIPSREEIDRITREYFRQIGYRELSDETLDAQKGMKKTIRRILDIAGYAGNARLLLEAQVETERLRGVVHELERDMKGMLATLEMERQESRRYRDALESIVNLKPLPNHPEPGYVQLAMGSRLRARMALEASTSTSEPV